MPEPGEGGQGGHLKDQLTLFQPEEGRLSPPTEYGHPERVFFQKSRTFGLEQTFWAEIF